MAVDAISRGSLVPAEFAPPRLSHTGSRPSGQRQGKALDLGEPATNHLEVNVVDFMSDEVVRAATIHLASNHLRSCERMSDDLHFGLPTAGFIEMAGTVVEGSKGFRAERARIVGPVEVWVPCVDCGDQAMTVATTERDFRGRYKRHQNLEEVATTIREWTAMAISDLGQRYRVPIIEREESREWTQEKCSADNGCGVRTHLLGVWEVEPSRYLRLSRYRRRTDSQSGFGLFTGPVSPRLTTSHLARPTAAPQAHLPELFPQVSSV